MSLIDKLKNRSERQQAMDAMPRPTTEPFKDATVVADGWTYMDLPLLESDEFKLFCETVGPENMRWLTQTAMLPPRTGVRGQLFIHPNGMAKLNAYMKSKIQ